MLVLRPCSPVMTLELEATARAAIGAYVEGELAAD